MQTITALSCSTMLAKQKPEHLSAGLDGCPSWTYLELNNCEKLKTEGMTPNHFSLFFFLRKRHHRAGLSARCVFKAARRSCIGDTA